MTFSEYTWEYGKFGADSIRTTTMFGRKVDICQKSRGAPGETQHGMGVDKPSTYYRINNGDWIGSNYRSMVETVNVLSGILEDLSIQDRNLEICHQLDLERNKFEFKERR